MTSLLGDLRPVTQTWLWLCPQCGWATAAQGSRNCPPWAQSAAPGGYGHGLIQGDTRAGLPTPTWPLAGLAPCSCPGVQALQRAGCSSSKPSPHCHLKGLHPRVRGPGTGLASGSQGSILLPSLLERGLQARVLGEVSQPSSGNCSGCAGCPPRGAALHTPGSEPSQGRPASEGSCTPGRRPLAGCTRHRSLLAQASPLRG